MKNKTTAILLAFFFGGLGAHKFYLNKPVVGFAYLFFCWTLIPGLIAFFECVIMLTMDNKKFQEKYSL